MQQVDGIRLLTDVGGMLRNELVVGPSLYYTGARNNLFLDQSTMVEYVIRMFLKRL